MSSASRKLQFELLEPRQVLSSVTLCPVADTYTREGVNAGFAPTLETRDLNGAGGDYMAYLRFDLSSVDLTGLTNAYLTLHKVGGATIVIDRFDVFGLRNLAGNTPQDWNEATLANAGLGAEYTNTGGNYLDLSKVVNLSGEGPAGANVIEQVSGTSQHLSGVDVVSFLEDRKATGGTPIPRETWMDAIFSFGNAITASSKALSCQRSVRQARPETRFLLPSLGQVLHLRAATKNQLRSCTLIG